MPTWTAVPCALSRWMYSRSVDAVGLLVNPDHSVNLLTFGVSWHNPDSTTLQMGLAQTLYFCLSSLQRGGKHNLPTNVGEHIEMSFTALVPVRSHKGIKLHLGHCGFSEGHKREETKFVILRHSLYGKLSQQPQKTNVRE